MDEFFLTSATLKLTLWKDNQKVEAKVFGSSWFCSESLRFLLTSTAEVGTPVLPRFFLVTSQSGVKSDDGARTRSWTQPRDRAMRLYHVDVSISQWIHRDSPRTHVIVILNVTPSAIYAPFYVYAQDRPHPG